MSRTPSLMADLYIKRNINCGNETVLLQAVLEAISKQIPVILITGIYPSTPPLPLVTWILIGFVGF